MANFTTIYRKNIINTLKKIWKFIDNLGRTSICHRSVVTFKVLSDSISFKQVVDNYRAKGLMWLRVSGLKKIWRNYGIWKWMESLSIIFCRLLDPPWRESSRHCRPHQLQAAVSTVHSRFCVSHLKYRLIKRTTVWVGKSHLRNESYLGAKRIFVIIYYRR